MPDPMTDERLDEIEAIWRAASPGNWQTRFIYRLFTAARKDPGLLIPEPPETDWPNAEFMASANNWIVPDLIAEVRRLRAENEQLLREVTMFADERDARMEKEHPEVMGMITDEIIRPITRDELRAVVGSLTAELAEADRLSPPAAEMVAGLSAFADHLEGGGTVDTWPGTHTRVIDDETT